MSSPKIGLLLVDDDPSAIQALSRMLAPYPDQRFATSGEAALRVARETIPDLILLDADMPGMHGFAVLDALKSEPETADVPVIIVTSHSDSAFEVTGLEMGAADFIAKPVSAPLVLARVRTQLRLKHLADELRRKVNTDGLTGVANRRQFNESLEREWLRAQRGGDALALLMVDVDHFKLYNDHYGHPKGDDCLKMVAQALVGVSLRPADLVARYGGEEFVLLLPHTPRGGAQHMAQRVLSAVEALTIVHAASPTARHMTASVGIACYDDASRCWASPSPELRLAADPAARCSATDLVLAADRALYRAKLAGRAQARLLDIGDVIAGGVANVVANAVPRCVTGVDAEPESPSCATLD